MHTPFVDKSPHTPFVDKSPHTPFVDKSPHRRDGASAGSWLKQRLAQILTRSSCAAAANSDTAFVSLAKANAEDSPHQLAELAPPSPYFCTPCTYERPKQLAGRPRRRSRSASLVHISVDCTGGAVSGRRSVRSDAPLLLQRPSSSLPAREKQSRRRRSKPAARSSPSASRRHCSTTSAAAWGRARRPRRDPAPYSWSSSSCTATDDELAPFSSDEDERGGEEAETRTPFSSLSFSSDSTSEFYHTGSGAGNNNNARTRRGNATRHAPRRALLPRTVSGPTTPAADGAFRPLISVEPKKKHGSGWCNDDRKTAEEKQGATAVKKLVDTKEAGPGMAVVKRSSNPYADFRSSMVEMVVERRIGSVEQMEDLLGSYLSLNSPRHHPAILAAFEDVWEAVFGDE